MELVTQVQGYLSSWSKNGESECRNLLVPFHSNPTDPRSSNALTTAYHTLLLSTLVTWPAKHTLSSDALIRFVEATLQGLPGTSHDASPTPSATQAFGELLVDTIWATDEQLDIVVGDAKAAAEAKAKGEIAESEAAATVKAKQNAEKDKETLVYITKQLLRAGILDPNLCRERLDMTLIVNAGLWADKLAYEKKEIRTRTGLFYKQTKYNLLREQSEGFSKLIAEVTSSLPPPHLASIALPAESHAELIERAQPVWERVVSIVGYFDLDPNRALDLILDVFDVHLTTHWSFFLVLLGLSPWKGHSAVQVEKAKGKGLLDVNGDVDMDGEAKVSPYAGKTLDEVLTIAEGENAPRARPPPKGSNPRVLAQVLGFKFRHYQSPDVPESTPQSLDLTAALLIRDGFITLEDLYPHLTPSEEDMEEVEHKAYLASVQARINAVKFSSALAMAAPLESRSSRSSATATDSKKPAATPSEPKRVPNQKLGVLLALLGVGALRPALAILSKYRWMVDAHPEIADLLLRILRHSVDPLYQSNQVQKEHSPSYTQPKARYTGSGTLQVPTRKVTLSTTAPTPTPTSTMEWVYFYPLWKDRVPLATTMEDLVDVVEPLMAFVGLQISRDPIFMTKFMRLGRSQIIKDQAPDAKYIDPEHPTGQFWIKILRLYLLPALPLIRGNAVCTVEIWNLLRQFETTDRWRLYGEWRNRMYSSHPELRVRQAETDREAKAVLRRLTKDNVLMYEGTVAKLAHSNPLPFFALVVQQVTAYENMAETAIKSMRYLTNMGFDILGFTILDALANPNKERVKADGVNTSDWLLSLAAFSGALYRRYAADIGPILRYIVNQLYNNQTSDIVVLRELIRHMAGIEPLPSMTESQIVALAGGQTLRIEAIASYTRGAKLEPGDVSYKGPGRLGRYLLETDLARPLLVQVAQMRQSAVYQAQNTPLKSLSNLFDMTHGVLMQYLEVTTTPSIVSLKDYEEKVVPKLTDLHEVYGIAAPICMLIIRPIVQAAILSAALAAQEQERVASEEAEKRLKAALAAKRDPTATSSRIASPMVGDTSTASITEGNGEMKLTVSESKSSVDVDMSPPVESPWLPQLREYFDDLKRIAPKEAMNIFGPGFYATFWQLSMYDLAPPAAKYEEEGQALRALARSEDGLYNAADRSPSRAIRQTASAHRQKRDRYTTTVNLLAQEFKEQATMREFTLKRLEKEKTHWFPNATKAAVLVSAVIEHCLQPRCLLSPMDADFCAQIIKVLHNLGTPGWSTLMVYDKLLGDHVRVVVFSCSEYEARNYGRFLRGILTDLHKWFKDERAYVSENRVKGKTTCLPGFQHAWSNKPVIEQSDILSWHNFQQIVRKWHKKLFKSLVDCIQTGEFMHVYNTLFVLKELMPVFPLASVMDRIGPGLFQQIEHLVEKEERGDLKVLAQSISVGMTKRESYWAPPKNAAARPAAPSPKPSTTTSTDKTKTNAPPSGPASSQPSDKARPVAAPTPSAPRAQLVNGNSSGRESPSLSSTKLAMNSIPRPEVVKRVRPEPRSDTPTQPATNGRNTPSKPAEQMNVDQPSSTSDSKSSAPASDSRSSLRDAASALRPTRNGNTGTSSNAPSPRPESPASLAARKPLPPLKTATPPTTVPQAGSASATNGSTTTAKAPPQSPRSHRPLDERVTTARADVPTPVMPPPSTPSQTVSAQELRESAKQTIGRKQEVVEDKSGKAPPSEPRGTPRPGTPRPSSPPRHRSPSPPTRPGTRNTSLESKNSGGRPKADRDGERTLESKRDERDSSGRQEPRTSDRRDAAHGRERRERTTSGRDGERERDRDKDRGRDRHGDRERDRDRDRRERDKDKEDRDHRDKDRERGDRHRRDEKDRERDGSRRERDGAGRGSGPSTDERALPTRPDPSRHRAQPTSDEALGKRRRPTDDEPERASKRRDKSHREDRGRRSSEKEHDRGRDSDRRRRERDGTDGDKASEKRPPEGPAAIKNLPSAPRAMASVEPARSSSKIEPSSNGRDRIGKDTAPHLTAPGPAGTTASARTSTTAVAAIITPTAATSSVPEPSGGGSLRSRIGEREIARLPQAPNASRGDAPTTTDKGRDDRVPETPKKRTVAELEAGNPPLPPSAVEPPSQPPKRIKLNRGRYADPPTGSSGAPGAGAFAKKMLPIDPQAGDKGRPPRKN